MPEALIIADEAGRIVETNVQAERLFGYTRQEMLGQTVEMLVPERHRSLHAEERLRFVHSRRMRPMGTGLDIRARRKDGTEFPVDIALSSFETEEGLRIMAVIRDMSEQQRLKRFTENILATVPSGLVAFGKNLEVLSVNRSFCELFGVSTQQVVGKPVDEILESIGFPEECRTAIVRQQRLRNCECTISTAAKGTMALNLTLSGIRVAEEEEEEELLLVIDDITERKRAEEALRESEERFRFLAESSLTGIYLIQDQRFSYVNQSLASTFGYTVDELVGKKSPLDLTHPDDRARVVENMRRRIAGEVEAIRYDFKGLKKDGTVLYIEVHGKRIEYAGKIGIIGTLLDITERKRAEMFQAEWSRVLESIAADQELSQVLEDITLTIEKYMPGMKASILLLDPATQCLRHGAAPGLPADYNAAVDGLRIGPKAGSCGTAAYKKELVIVENIQTDPLWEDYHELAARHNLRACWSLPIIDPEGEAVLGTFALYYEQPRRPNEKELQLIRTASYIAGIAIKRDRAQKALLASEAKYRTLFLNVPIGVFHTTPDGRILTANPALVKMLGYESEQELKKIDIARDLYVNPADRTRYIQMIEKQGKVDNFEITLKRKDGKPITVLENARVVRDEQGALLYYEGTLTDITKQKNLQAQLIQSQKLESLGTLTGGIAHDFNNILVPILSYADMALFNLKETEPLHHDLQQILKAAHRAKDLVEQILLFAKQSEKERQPLALQPLIKEALKLLRSSIPATVDIQQRIDPDCEKVLADASQIHQVIVNLCTNAWQAMEEKGGTLTIELKQVHLDATAARFFPNLTEGDHARLTIADTGCGMDQATLERIFEPFFTTKAVNKGTGLGLSVVHGIVRSHKGHIQVESEPGKGSAFHIYLPVFKAEAKKAEPEVKEITGGQESILVVDDDEVVAELMKKMLESLGYNVEVCDSGIQAQKAFRLQPEKYDLLISDLTMPNMTGLDLAEQVQKVRAGFPVIIMTGYGDSLNEDTRRTYGIKQVVGKPLEMHKLATAVREVLEK